MLLTPKLIKYENSKTTNIPNISLKNGIKTLSNLLIIPLIKKIKNNHLLSEASLC